MKKGKIESIGMADGQCGYAYGGRIYTASQFKNLYAQGGVHSDEAQDRALISKMIAEHESSEKDNMADGGTKKKSYAEDVKDPNSKKVFSGGVDKKGNKTYSLIDDMTNENIAAGGGNRTDYSEQQPVANTNQNATRFPSGSGDPNPEDQSNTQKNTQGPTDGQTFAGSFSQAFGSARKSGLKTFTWNGKLFGTKLASESDQGPIADNTKREGVISNSGDKEQSTLGRKITPEAEKMYAKQYSGLPDAMPNEPAPTMNPAARWASKDEAKKTLASNWKKSKGKGGTGKGPIQTASE